MTWSFDKERSTLNLPVAPSEPLPGQEPPANDMPVASNSETPPKRSGRYLGVLVVLLLTAGWLAPTIVGQTSLRQKIPGLLFPHFTGTMTIGEASLGWLNAIELRNVLVKDAQGEIIATIPRLTSDATLVSIIRQPAAPGTMTLHQPVIELKLDEASSNVERLLSELLTGESSGGPYSYTFKIDQGKVNWKETTSPRAFVIDGLNVSFTTLGDAHSNRLAAQVKSEIKGDRFQTPLSIDFDSLSTGGDTPNSQGKLDIQCDALPLEIGEVLAKRSYPEARLAGILSASGKANWKFPPEIEKAEWTWNGQIGLTDLAIAGFPQMGNDLPQFKAIVLAGEASQSGPVATFRKLRLSTDVGGIDLDGPVPTAALLSAMTGDSNATTALAELGDFRLSAAVDLARLAKLLPATLRIREGISIEAGRLEAMAVSSRPAQGQQQWVVSSKLEGLEAREQGRKLSWPEPVSARLVMLIEQGVAEVESLNVQSPFMVATGRGTIDAGEVRLQANLAKLAEEMGRFLDLGGLTLAGELNGNMALERTTTERVKVTGEFQASQFVLSLPTAEQPAKEFVWAEPDLRIGGEAILYAPAGKAPSQALSGTFVVASASDKLTANILQPVLFDGSTGGLDLTLQGGAGRWLTRARSLNLVGAYEANGLVEQSATVLWDKSTLNLQGGKLRWSDAQLLGSGIQLVDREIRVDLSSSMDRQSGQVKLPELLVRSSAIILDGKNIVYAGNANGIQALAGDVGLKADLATLARWTNSSAVPMTTVPVGIVTGTVKVEAQGSSVQLDTQLQSDRIEIQSLTSRPGEPGVWQPLFSETNITSQLLVKGTLGQNNWELASFSLQGSGLGMTSRGRLNLDETQPRVELTGELAYDWDRLTPRLATNTSNGSPSRTLRITGKGQRKFQLIGNLPSSGMAMTTPSVNVSTSGVPASDLAWIKSFTGEAGIGWDDASYMNLEIGAVELGGRLEDGWLRMTPINTTVNQGRVMLAPAVHLAAPVPVIILPKGEVAQNVQFSQELCETWLKYAVPLLADATRVSGSTSLELAGGQIPLSNMNGADVGGVLKIHGAEVAAGPLAMQITGVIQQIRAVIDRGAGTGNGGTLMRMPEQQTEFRLVNGRLHHRQLIFETSLATIRTTGSVGLDESLQMVVQIPLLDDWIGDRPVLQALKGQTINIPVGGTLSRPQVDGRAIGDLAKRVAGSAVESLIDGKLPGGLDRLLRPR